MQGIQHRSQATLRNKYAILVTASEVSRNSGHQSNRDHFLSSRRAYSPSSLPLTHQDCEAPEMEISMWGGGGEVGGDTSTLEKSIIFPIQQINLLQLFIFSFFCWGHRL